MKEIPLNNPKELFLPKTAVFGKRINENASAIPRARRLYLCGGGKSSTPTKYNAQVKAINVTKTQSKPVRTYTATTHAPCFFVILKIMEQAVKITYKTLSTQRTGTSVP